MTRSVAHAPWQVSRRCHDSPELRRTRTHSSGRDAAGREPTHVARSAGRGHGGQSHEVRAARRVIDGGALRASASAGK